MKDVYFISGLGADERVFKKLDIPNINAHYIKWEKPHEKETLQAYCKRLLAQIDASKPVYLIGVSFGGMIAQEVARLIPCEKVIIISSIKSVSEMDWTFRVSRYLKLHKIVPFGLLEFFSDIVVYYFNGAKTSEDKRMLKNVRKDNDPALTRWAIHRIIEWQIREPLPGVVHIHGDKDKIFPIRCIKGCIRVKGGEHLMVYSMAREVSRVINEVLEK